MKCRMQSNTIDTCSSFSNRRSHKMVDQGSGLDISELIALIKKLFPMPASPLKNTWNGWGGNSLFFSANLQCNVHYKIEQMLLTFIQLRVYFKKLFIRKWYLVSIIVDTADALLTLSLSSKSRSRKLGFIIENSALSSSSTDWTKLKFCNSS